MEAEGNEDSGRPQIVRQTAKEAGRYADAPEAQQSGLNTEYPSFARTAGRATQSTHATGIQ
jgi:hypothetical protein